MANIITTTEVFEFMGTESGLIDNHSDAVLLLICELQQQIQHELGRSIESATLTAEALNIGEHFKFSNDYTKIMLINQYMDIYTITALTEAGTALTESTAYNDSNDYIVNYKTGVIQRLNTTWNTSDFAVTITGKYGYVNSDDSARDDIKLLLKEMVSARSGLWKKNYISPEGEIQTSKDSVDKYMRDKLRGHIRMSLI